jgi:anthranilate synthase component I
VFLTSSAVSINIRSPRLFKLNLAGNQFDLFKKINELYEKVFILESLVGPRELSEISIIGFDPEIVVFCDTKKFYVSNRKEVIKKVDVTEPISQLRKIMPRISDQRFRYFGGAVGYVSYDAIHFWEKIRSKAKEKKYRFPLIEFGIYTDGILYNHSENQAYYFSVGKQSRLKEIQEKMEKINIHKIPQSLSYTRPKRTITKNHFIKMVNKSKRYIYNGDIYQVVLSKNIKFIIKGNLIVFYEHLRKINPSPYMFMLRLKERCVVGSSPEMLLRVTKGIVETFPIAGTRQVVKDHKKNQRLRSDLLNDEKELAEHTMLVDLARNDIGKVCEYGTVKVQDFLSIKRFSHVQHIVSHVIGHLRKDTDSYDAFKAVFPAGTVSGAPKIRAMEIIDELEPNSRGPYAGAIGYFSFNGSCDFAITIRSLFVNNQDAYIQSGAGIVTDSVPQYEWIETNQKAAALLLALSKTKGKH